MLAAARIRHRGRAGYSLIEVVTVLSLAALAAALFAHGISASSRGRGTSAAARELLLCLRGAHWKAVVSGKRRRLVSLEEGEKGAITYIIEKEEKGGWVSDGARHRVPRGIGFRTTGPPVKLFHPNGTSSFGSFFLESAGGKSYRISLNPLTGRARLYRGDQEVGGAE